MPLSEEEQRLLQQMEQALAAEDPSLASTLRGSKMRARNRRQAIASVLGFILGIGILMVGVIATLTVVGVVGFLVMLATAYLFIVAWRRGVGSADDDSDDETDAPDTEHHHGIRGLRHSRSSSSGSFMERMEERWRRRRDSDM
ncbi:MAG TPA: DUF3040 domain-containing protein [Nocardioidaceae bacterium]|nr:DUF3040 domain-containing protein [Nocardioidaceae bacterium]